MTIPSVAETAIRQIANVLESAATHRDLSALFAECHIAEHGGNPRWERITLALVARQRQDRCANNVGAFIQAVMNPVRFVGDAARFEELRHKLNPVLSFIGLELGTDGQLKAVSAARTLSEAAKRAGQLRQHLQQRQVHADVLAFCREVSLSPEFGPLAA